MAEPTPEQVIEIQRLAAEAGLRTKQMEDERSLKINIMEQRSRNLRAAQDVLLENQRSKPFSERNVSAEDLIAFAQTLQEYVTSNVSLTSSVSTTL